MRLKSQNAAGFNHTVSGEDAEMRKKGVINKERKKVLKLGV